MDPSQEEKLIKSVLSGNTDDFRPFVLENQNLIYSMLRKQGLDESVAKDITQDTFTRAFKSLDKFNFDSSFSTWITRIALNCSASYFKSKHYISQKSYVQLESEQLKEQEPCDKEEKIKELKQKVASLKEIYRQVIVLCCFEGKSYKEASKILDIPSGTVASRMNKSIHLLKDLYKDQDSDNTSANYTVLSSFLLVLCQGVSK